MNKQYVQEQIKIAISELRKEYDIVIGNIYQCPDCGALAFKNSEHVCLGKAKLPSTMPPHRGVKKQVVDYILDALESIPPSYEVEFLEIDSPYLIENVGKRVESMGGPVKSSSVGSNINTYMKQSTAIKRRPVVIKYKKRSKSGKEFDCIDTCFAYWRAV